MSEKEFGSERGVIAAGHRCTAEAGAEMLEAGGNAADAAIAALFAAVTAEPTLTGLGAGGFALVHDPKTREDSLLDFFVAVPGLAPPHGDVADLIPTPVDFGETVQVFYAGHASIAVPGLVAGIFDLHRRYGSLPMSEVIRPAVRLAKNGVPQTQQQERLHALLFEVQTLTPASAAYFAPNGHSLRVGESFQMRGYDETLQILAEQGADGFYRGDLSKLILETIAEGGGRLTAKDLAAYRVIERKPVKLQYRGRDVSTNPSPSIGGALVALMLAELDKHTLKGDSFHNADHLIRLAQTLTKGRDALHDQTLLGNTTHISVLDAQGMAVSLTSSNGTGSGVAVPGTGIIFNNMLGEDDLKPADGEYVAGERLPSMMSPTLVHGGDGVDIVIGSAGSNRICSAVTQVLSALIDFGLPVEDAVEAPRLHIEKDRVEAEGGIASEAIDGLRNAGFDVNAWATKNLYFGGLQAVTRTPEGRLIGHGDPRRGGVAISV